MEAKYDAAAMCLENLNETEIELQRTLDVAYRVIFLRKSVTSLRREQAEAMDRALMALLEKVACSCSMYADQTEDYERALQDDA